MRCKKISVAAPKLWNSLPEAIRLSVDTLSHASQIQFYSLDLNCVTFYLCFYFLFCICHCEVLWSKKLFLLLLTYLKFNVLPFINLQTHGCITQTALPASYFLFSPVPVATCPHQQSLLHFFFLKAHSSLYTIHPLIYLLHSLMVHHCNLSSFVQVPASYKLR